jgi:phosphoglycerol transferase MdoB-like AlkP superfamily enzyme
MHYVDSAIGMFRERLSEMGLASNTVLVVYGDHRARFIMEDLRMIGIEDENEMMKVPVIINIPDRTIDASGNTYGGLIDVAPTVLNIMGIDDRDKFFMGRDLLNSEGEGFVIFRDGSVIGSPGMPSADYLRISDLIIEKDIIPAMRDRLEVNSVK